MPSVYYKRDHQPEHYYHIYNRGANKLKIFRDPHDYRTFVSIIAYFMKFPDGKSYSKFVQSQGRNLTVTKPSFDMLAYCLMPNHFHFMIKQVSEPTHKTSITNFMKRITITYAMYLKWKYERSGALLEGKYKNILVKSESQFLYLSKYIHRNPIQILSSASGSEPALDDYPYSSYQYYVSETRTPTWLQTEHILSQFSNDKNLYKGFVEENNGIQDNLPDKILID